MKKCYRRIMQHLALAFLVVLGGCLHAKKETHGSYVASINFWASPNDPSLFVGLEEEGIVYVSQYLRGKRTHSTLRISEEKFNELLNTARNAHAEIKSTKTFPDAIDGANIEIVINDQEKSTARIKGYSSQLYSMEHLVRMNKMLREILPKKYMR